MKRAIIMLAGILVLVSLFAACGPKQPANDLEAILQKEKMVVGTSADWPPYESVDASGEIVGYDMDIIREIGKRLGIEVEVQDIGFDGLIAALQEGKVDVVISSMQYTEERDQQVDFSDGYHQPKEALIVRQGSDIALEQKEDIVDYSVCVVKGTSYEYWVTTEFVEKGLMSEDQVLHHDAADQDLLDVKNGRCDIAIENSDAAPKMMETIGDLEIALIAPSYGGPQSIAIREGQTELKAKLDEIITAMRDEGLLDQYGEKWGIE